MLNIYLISEFGDLLRDIPVAFADPQVRICPIGGTHSVLNKQDNFLELQSLPNKTFMQTLLLNLDLINSIDGLVLIGSDPEMREIAEAEVDLDIKLKLLPIRNPEAFKILDSKVGLQEVLQKLQLPVPSGQIINGLEDLNNLGSRFKHPYLIKGDAGGGGVYIRRVSADSPHPSIDDITFPFLLQEEIVGSEISVDAFFNEGILRAYVYSDEIKSKRKYGPSYMRRIARPPTEDFLSTLQAIGEFAGVRGLVNGTFIFDPRLNKHFMIEFDPRPNAWQFLAPMYGIDLISIFGGSKSERIDTPNKVNVQIVLLDRFNNYLLDINNPWKYIKAAKELFDPECMVFSRKKLNTLEILKNLISQLPKNLAFKILRKIFRLLPSMILNPIKQRKLTNRMAQKVLGRI